MKMKFFRPALVLALTFGVFGCSINNLSTVKPPETPQAQSVKTGSLGITIRWPKSYNTAFIPDSTSRIDLLIKQGETVLATPSITRNQGQGTVTATYTLPAVNNISIQATAYRPETGEAIAQSSQSSVNIPVGKVVSATLTMAPLNFPAIVSTVPNVGKVGDTIHFNGTKLGLTASDTIKVVFEGGATASTSWVSPTQIDLTIPSGAQCGTVSVTVDGVKSLSNVPFWVASALDVQPTTPIAVIVYGQSVPLTITPTWVDANGKLGSLGAAPEPTWTYNQLDGVDCGLVDGGAFVAGNKTGMASIFGHLGGVTSNELSFSILNDITVQSDTLDITQGSWILPGDEGITP